MDIFDIKLHQTLVITHNLKVTRVPGGWLYHYKPTGWKPDETERQDAATEAFSSTFVRYEPQYRL